MNVHALKALCLCLEAAQARQNEAIAHAQARLFPESGARVARIKGAFALFLGEGHMLNQGLALGLEDDLEEADLEALEGVCGLPCTVELSAGADTGLHQRLTQRGYQLNAWQQVWMRNLGDLSLEAPLNVRPIRPEEARLFARVVVAGFCERNELNTEGEDLFLAATEAQGNTCFLAFAGDEPVGGATLYLGSEGVGVLSGASVLPAHRGRGVQASLIAARLAFAQAKGCRRACSASAPFSVSGRNLQRHGFEAAYPKVELIRPCAVR